MKKRFLSIALTLCMLLTVLLMTPLTATADEPVYTTISGIDSFVEWNGEGDKPTTPYKWYRVGSWGYYFPTGNFRLTGDIDNFSFTIQPGSVVTIDLNGHTVHNTTSGTIFYIAKGAANSLTFEDSSTNKTGEVRNDAGCAVDVNENTEFNGNNVPIYGKVKNGGAISGGVFHGEVVSNSSTTTITGGTFNGTVTGSCTITGGTFYGSVNKNYGNISGGTFYGSVNSNYDEIRGGIFYGSKDGIDADTTHKITFMDGDETWAIEVLDGTSASYEPDTPTKTGWVFDGWYDGEAKFVFGSAITDDLTLTAKWTCAGHVNDDEKDHKCDICGAVLSSCSGGIATCIDKAVCDYCGKPYGEVDATNHTTLKHIEAKAATTESEGNIEYWHCEDCNKYFSDKDCKNEITLADTVIAKLPSQDTSPKTGDNSRMALWFALLFVSGGALIGTAAYGKKKKHFEK